MYERPTCRVYIEILTCAPIFLGVEESRSHTNEREAEQAQPQGARPAPQGACPPVMANHSESRGLCSTASED